MPMTFPILLTNDDGINSPGLQELASSLNGRGHPVVVLAPLTEQSAVGMKLTLRDDMAFQEHTDIADNIRVNDAPLRVFSLDGSPCDCVIVAIDGGLRTWAPEIEPWMCISGINRGPNLSVDVLHSGTVSAARESALYGLPSLSVSLATYSHEDYSDSIRATLDVIDGLSPGVIDKPENLLRPEGSKKKPLHGLGPDSIRTWFLQGNLFLNLNVPETWDGSFQTVPLGARWYHNATDMMQKDSMGIAFEVGAARIVDEDIEMTDCNAVNSGKAALTPLASWPQNHPLGVPQTVMEASNNMGKDGMPEWF
tara:strand:+ start:1262 stop:2188 length:927 start_codon:yes stop_codon:yes gene_type:complete